jgi:hypothetical protein
MAKKRSSVFGFMTFMVAVGVLGGGVFMGYRIVRNFPWTFKSTRFDMAKGTLFSIPWPMSPTEEEKASKKSAKRFPKNEMARRANIQLRRMKTLHTPIFDIFSDSTVQHVPALDGMNGAFTPLFSFPVLDTERVIQSGNGTRNISYVVVPYAHGSVLEEGMLLKGGEELRFQFPVVRNRRHLLFSVLPLTPGTMRVYFGQYTVSKVFSELDVHKQQVISIPVNDTTANAMRIASLSSHFYILQPKVYQREPTGRLPIQVSAKSKLWAFKGGSAAPIVPEVPVDPAAEHILEKSEDEPLPKPASPSEKEAHPEHAAGVAPTPVAEPELPIFDPASEVENPQVSVQDKASVALGYNVLLLQLESIPQEVLADHEFFEKSAPHLFQLMKNSLQVSLTPNLPLGSRLLFHKTVLGNGVLSEESENPFLLKRMLEKANGETLYQRFRNYGYHVVSMGPSEAYGLNEGISYGSESPPLEGRWLTPNDWNFAKRNKDIEDEMKEPTGLEAIFASQAHQIPPPFSDVELQKLSRYSEFLAQNMGHTPDWRANQLYFLDNRFMYHPRVIDAFQNWSKSQNVSRGGFQSRSMVHVILDAMDGTSRPTFKDFVSVLKHRSFGALSEKMRESYTRLVLLDRSVGQMLETLNARLLEHRTVVAVMIPGQEVSANQTRSGSVFLKVPGLLPQRESQKATAPLSTVLSTLLSVVGIPSDTPPIDEYHPNKVAAEPPVLPPIETAEKAVPGRELNSTMTALPDVKRYNLFLNPGKNGCLPFEWNTRDRIFGLQSSHPIVEHSIERGILKFYPCATSANLVKIHWFQEKRKVENSEPEKETKRDSRKERDYRREREKEHDLFVDENRLTPLIGGFFHSREQVNPGKSELPVFYFGKKSLRLGTLPFSLVKLNEQEVHSIFDRDDARNISEDLVLRKLNLARVHAHRKDKEKTTLLFWRSEAF